MVPIPGVRDDWWKTIRWYHRIDLGHGVTTPGVDDTPGKLPLMNLPADLTGKSVLDIGAWDGFFSFEAERRGASRVVALDWDVWKSEAIGKAGFQYARAALASKVEDVEMEVLDICPEAVGVFDLVLFLGVLYHMPHPLLALQRVASVTGEHLILETHVDALESDRPRIAFYPGDECAGDPSNWCGPNRSAVEAMLRTVGFQEVQTSPVIRAPYAVRGTPRRRFGRMIFHAWKSVQPGRHQPLAAQPRPFGSTRGV